jgi:hypothetical protein
MYLVNKKFGKSTCKGCVKFAEDVYRHATYNLSTVFNKCHPKEP